MRSILLVACLAAGAHAAPKPAAHYAKVFQKDHTLTYDVTLTTWDTEKVEAMQKRSTASIPQSRWPRKTTKFAITCKVTRVATFATSVHTLNRRKMAPHVRTAMSTQPGRQQNW